MGNVRVELRIEECFSDRLRFFRCCSANKTCQEGMHAGSFGYFLPSICSKQSLSPPAHMEGNPELPADLSVRIQAGAWFLKQAEDLAGMTLAA